MAETKFAKQVKTEKHEKDYPKSYEDLSVKKTPSVSEVSHGKEFEREDKFNEA